MRYFDCSVPEAVRSLQVGAAVRRDVKNQHDPNAIEVLVNSKTLGYIDRKSAGRIAMAIDRGASASIRLNKSAKSTKGSVPVIVVIEQQPEQTDCPLVCDPNTIGIYHIRVIPERKTYYGQSLDVQNRILQHWSELSISFHTNPELQRYWNEHGPQHFKAKLVETAPKNLADLNLARWLVTREKYWIENEGGLKKVINAETPQPVLTKIARQQLEIEKQACEPEIKKIQGSIEKIDGDIQNLQHLIQSYLDKIQASKKMWSIFVSKIEKEKAAQAKENLPFAKERLQYSESERHNLQRRMNEINEHLFIKREF